MSREKYKSLSDINHGVIDRHLTDDPRLMNGYGELFEYKDSEKAKLASEKIHQKKLNLERENRKLRVAKKDEKNNYYKFKTTQKTSYKSEKSGCRMKYLSEKAILKDIKKYSDRLITINEFLKQELKNTNKAIKDNYKSTKKTLNSMRMSGDENEVINKKINLYHIDSIKIEQQLYALKGFLTDFSKIEFKDNDLESVQNFTQTAMKYLITDLSEHEEFIQDKVKKVYNAYKLQYYFKYHGKDINYAESMKSAKEKYKEGRKACKVNYKTTVKAELDKINSKCRDGIAVNSKEYEYHLNKIKMEEVDNEQKQLNDEIKKISLEKQNKVKEIKKAKKAEYKKQVKEFKKEHIKTFSVSTNKKCEIEVSAYNTSIGFLFNNKLRSINSWEYKNELSKLKANYWKDLGAAIKEYTYDGEFYEKRGEALANFNLAQESNNKALWNAIKEKELVSRFKLMSPEDKEIYLEKKQALDTKYHEDMASLKDRYLNKKEITKVAYKNEKMKLQIFHEEDIKAIKLSLASSKEKYEANDIINNYSRQTKLNKKELEQAYNNISKEVPIECKKNTSIWMSIIAFLLPGVDQLIIKNWKKAFWMILLTVLCWAVFVPYAFGAYNIQGQGIIGLVRLSWVVEYSPVYGNLYSDARYALVEGVIGVILLIISISYFVIASYQCYRITRSMEKGIRSNTWLETKKILRTSGFPYAISLPGLFFIAFIVIMPIIVSLLLAFTNIGTDHNPAAGQETNWVGFKEFEVLFNNPEFFKPLGNVLGWNLIWAISVTVLVLFLGTVMALAIENRNIKAKALWRTIFILPWAVPAFVSILFFKVIFTNGSNGIMNQWLLNWGVIDKAINWQSEVVASRLILILIQGWLGHSYIVLLVSGNIKAIPSDIYEAARIDGATPFKQFLKLTLPIVLLQIAPLLIGQFTFNFNNFSIIWLFNDGGSKIDPSYIYNIGNCDILLSWIFKMTFGSSAAQVESNQAISSALVIVMSLFVVTASGIGFARSKAFKRGEDI